MFIFKRSILFVLKNLKIPVRIKIKSFLEIHYSAASEQIQLPNAARKLKSLPTPKSLDFKREKTFK